jgi:hypothetical protein
MCLCRCKNECLRSSRRCSGSRRRWGCAGAGAGTPAVRVAARAVTMRRGGSRGSQRGVRKAAARRGRARGLVQSGAGAAGALHMAGRAAAARGQRNRGGRVEVDERGLKSKSPKTQGLHCNVQVTFKPELK